MDKMNLREFYIYRLNPLKNFDGIIDGVRSNSSDISGKLNYIYETIERYIGAKYFIDLSDLSGEENESPKSPFEFSDNFYDRSEHLLSIS